MHGACGIAIYFNKALCEDTRAVADLLDELTEAGFVDVENWTQLFIPIARRNARPKPYVRDSVLRTVARAKSHTASVRTTTETNQQDSFELHIDCAPTTQPVYGIYGELIEDPVWRYQLKWHSCTFSGSASGSHWRPGGHPPLPTGARAVCA